MHIILQRLKSLKFGVNGFGKVVNLKMIFAEFRQHHNLSIKMEFELENEVSHHSEKYKESEENENVNPVDLKDNKVPVIWI